MTQELADKLIAAYEHNIDALRSREKAHVPRLLQRGICLASTMILHTNIRNCKWVKSKFPQSQSDFWCDTPSTLLLRMRLSRSAINVEELKQQIIASHQTRIDILKQFKTDMLSWKA